MAITGGFGSTLDLQTRRSRQWYMRSDGIKRWADNDKPVPTGPDCDRSACGDFSPGECDHPECHARRDR